MAAPQSPSDTASLVDLPPELLLQIISETLPEGFESLALSCKAVYQLCTPFIKQHNLRRAQFRKFQYSPFPDSGQDPLRTPIYHAYDLIERIAREPIVARYIQHADLGRDSRNLIHPPGRIQSGIDRNGPVAALFANSPCLKQAGLDWREYHKHIADDYNKVHLLGRYSQHAAAFVLTLLPNAQYLKLPQLWVPTDLSHKLVNTVVERARQSLGFDSRTYLSSAIPPEVLRLSPFLALPELRSYNGPNPQAVSKTPGGVSHKQLPLGEKLESARIWSKPHEEVDLAAFLCSTGRLKTLTYHTGGVYYAHWDICRFLRLIEGEAETRLEGLAICLATAGHAIVPGHMSMRGFQCLRELQLPVELFACMISYIATRINKTLEDLSYGDMESLEVKLSDLVPASVTHLVLYSNGTAPHHGDALKILFHDFQAMKATRLPALEEIVFDRISR
ncbi:hypothetical protein PG997_001825 [Apiospora hydei]|uniref:F-box domain-containing protein n=1 Tax=Apiospora hydei TaxID=1337664 RepID=A0ABR1X7L0_9PEZI